MDQKIVYSKTGKGVLEIKSNARKLSRELAKVLSQVDGKSAVADLGAKSKLNEANLARCLKQLEDEGYIKEFAGLSSGMKSSASAGGASSYVDDLDFTSALSPGKAVYLNAQTEFRASESADRKRAEAEATRNRKAKEEKKRQEAKTQARKAKEAAAIKARKQAELDEKRMAAEMAKTTRDLAEILEVERRALEKTEGRRPAATPARSVGIGGSRGIDVDLRKREEEILRRYQEEQSRKQDPKAAKPAAPTTVANEEEDKRKREEEDRRKQEEEEQLKREKQERRKQEMAEFRKQQKAELERLEKEKREQKNLNVPTFDINTFEAMTGSESAGENTSANLEFPSLSSESDDAFSLDFDKQQEELAKQAAEEERRIHEAEEARLAIERAAREEEARAEAERRSAIELRPKCVPASSRRRKSAPNAKTTRERNTNARFRKRKTARGLHRRKNYRKSSSKSKRIASAARMI